MNSKKIDMIRELNNMTPNRYLLKKDLVGNFVDHAAKSLKKRHVLKGKTTYFYHINTIFGSINGLLPGSTGKLAYKICKDKHQTEEYLNYMSLPTLKSRSFTYKEKELAKNFLEKNSGETFVLKPLKLASGKGIIFNVDKDNFDKAYEESVKIQKSRNITEPSFILQSFLDGFDLRVCIVEGKYSCALWRVQPHIVGDGKSTVKELVDQKNNERNKSVYFKRFLYEIDEEVLIMLKSQNKDAHSVLKNGEVIFMSNLGNLAAGAESVDVTNRISENLIDIAIRAVAAIPGLHTAGVDILSKDFEGNDGYIIEINTNANHKVHYLPYYGEIRKPYQDMIENMLVKYKVDSGLGLTQEERRIYREIANFRKYKEYYHNEIASVVIK